MIGVRSCIISSHVPHCEQEKAASVVLLLVVGIWAGWATPAFALTPSSDTTPYKICYPLSPGAFGDAPCTLSPQHGKSRGHGAPHRRPSVRCLPPPLQPYPQAGTQRLLVGVGGQRWSGTHTRGRPKQFRNPASKPPAGALHSSGHRLPSESRCVLESRTS